tara:strand:+ start:2077 stop:2682 length:606 start_codon:yes stop_codon:yes gene_type:complete
MLRIIIILIFLLNLQSLTKANDISDFEIEGFSIGDSLLDYFSKSNLEKELRSEFSFKYKDNRFVGVGVGQTDEFPLFKKLDQFDEVTITIKPNDKKYLVHGISGEMLCYNNIDKCRSVKDQIINDLKDNFTGIEVDSWELDHPDDKTGKSTVYGNDLKSDNLNFNISVSIYDMSDDKYNDSVKLSIKTVELDNFIKYEAYE